jgi:putative tryptophan/tyrosine transport system substrate-binding protein
MVSAMRKAGVLSILFVVVLLAVAVIAQAQPPKKVYRIGHLSGSFPSPTSGIRSVQRELYNLGYVEGKNIAFEHRYAEDKPERSPALADELVRLKVDVIIAGGSRDTQAAKNATKTIPIVFLESVSDPVALGLVASLAHPGGNITGFTTIATVLAGKRLEILKEIIPKLSRVAVLGTSIQPGNVQQLKETEFTAQAFGVKLQYRDILSPKDIETAFRAASNGRAEAVLALGGPMLSNHRTQLIDLAVKSRLPAIYWRSDIVEAGGLMSYGVYLTALDRRAATYVDRILKGAQPADLPVEQPTKFQMVINLKTANQIGLRIPQRVLARADKVIK